MPTPENTPAPVETSGGLGGTPYYGDLKGDRLERRAIKERWPIPEHYRKPLVDRQVKIALDPDKTSREATSAFTALLQAERQNMQDDGIGDPSQQVNVNVSVNDDARRDFLISLREALKDVPGANQALAGFLRARVKTETKGERS